MTARPKHGTGNRPNLPLRVGAAAFVVALLGAGLGFWLDPNADGAAGDVASILLLVGVAVGFVAVVIGIAKVVAGGRGHREEP